jgi:hypothetical protein
MEVVKQRHGQLMHCKKPCHVTHLRLSCHAPAIGRHSISHHIFARYRQTDRYVKLVVKPWYLMSSDHSAGFRQADSDASLEPKLKFVKLLLVVCPVVSLVHMLKLAVATAVARRLELTFVRNKHTEPGYRSESSV